MSYSISQLVQFSKWIVNVVSEGLSWPHMTKAWYPQRAVVRFSKKIAPETECQSCNHASRRFLPISAARTLASFAYIGKCSTSEHSAMIDIPSMITMVVLRPDH